MTRADEKCKLEAGNRRLGRTGRGRRPHARARAFGRPGRQRVGRDDDDCLKDFGARYNFYKYLFLRHLRRAAGLRRPACFLAVGQARDGRERERGERRREGQFL